MARLPVPHRSAAFRQCYEEVQARLGALTGARHVTLLQGSGTLANDVVGVQLAQLDAPGVVVSNGEFGERLIDHAERLGLTHRAVRVAWGEGLDVDAIDAAMTSTRAQWLWAVHTETSTGVMNDLSVLRTFADRHGARLTLDTVSSIGVVPVSLDGVWMATAVSGKGLAAFPGVAIVLHNDRRSPRRVRRLRGGSCRHWPRRRLPHRPCTPFRSRQRAAPARLANSCARTVGMWVSRAPTCCNAIGCSCACSVSTRRRRWRRCRERWLPPCVARPPRVRPPILPFADSPLARPARLRSRSVPGGRDSTATPGRPVRCLR